MNEGQAVIAWAEVEILAHSVAEAARDFAPSAILAITRGGLIPATLIAHRLGVRRIETIQAASYSSDHDQDAVRLGPAPRFADSERVLIVDDLIDTGVTINAVGSLYPTAKTAVLLNKHPTANADFTGKRAPSGDWIVFPWEPR